MGVFEKTRIGPKMLCYFVLNQRSLCCIDFRNLHCRMALSSPSRRAKKSFRKGVDTKQFEANPMCMQWSS